MRSSKQKLQRFTLSSKNTSPYISTPNENTFYYTQKVGWTSKPTTRQNTAEKRGKSREKRSLEGISDKSHKKNLKSSLITKGLSLEVSQNHSILTKKSKEDVVMRRLLFKMHWKIGSGAFGKVWKVEYKKTKQVYAMKEISKIIVTMKKSVESILNEKILLGQLNNPFLVNMRCAFQDTENLYLVLDYLSGGDLRYHLFTRVDFSENECKFMVGCIVLALQYLRDNNIIHRDLKPENLVFDSSGYLRLTDFGIARQYKNNNSKETSGTPGYMAPEVLCHMNHSFEVDYFALGVIVYEIATKKRPYMASTRKEIRELVLAKQVCLKKQELPIGWSEDVLDFVNSLLTRNRQQRLGYKSFSEIKKHPWLSTINWSILKKKQLRPPFVPHNMCEKKEYLQQLETDYIDPEVQEMKLLLRNDEMQNLFRGYSDRGSMERESAGIQEREREKGGQYERLVKRISKGI